MKHYSNPVISLLLLFFFIGITSVEAQNISINADGSAPDNSAMLDISSSTRGLLVPRMTFLERTLILNPANSLLIYQTDNTPGYYYNSGTTAVPVWVQIGAPDNLGNHIATTNIQLGTNYLSGDGDSEGIYIDNTGSIGVGTATPSGKIDIVDNTEAFSINITNSTNSATDKKGVFSIVTGGGIGDSYGIYGEANAATGDKFGVFGGATGAGGIKYGLYGDASGAGTNWAGYFNDGNVFINNLLGIGTTPTNALSVAGNIDVTSTNFLTTTIESSNIDGAWLALGNTSTGGKYYQLVSTGSNNAQGAGKLLLGYGAAANGVDGLAMTLADNRVGIGTSAPDSSLTVIGGVKATYFTLTDGAASGSVLTSDANGVATWQPPLSKDFGAGAFGELTYFVSGDSLRSSNELFWDEASDQLRIGVTSEDAKLTVTSADTTTVFLRNNLTGFSTGTAAAMDIALSGANRFNYGINISASGGTFQTKGIRASVLGSGSATIFGVETSTNQTGTGSSFGGLMLSTAQDGAAIGLRARGNSTNSNSFGIDALANGTGGINYGVYGVSNGAATNNYGVYGSALNATGNNYGVYGNANGGTGVNYAGYFNIGNVFIRDTLILNETFRISNGAAVGNVLVSDANGNASWGTVTGFGNIYTDISNNVGNANRVAYWNNTDSLTYSNNLYFDELNNRVGIGTNIPFGKLEVAGDGSLIGGLRVSGTTAATVGASIYIDGANQDWTIYGSNNSASSGANKLVFRDYTNAADRMAIDNVGNVGIGTTNPSSLLHVHATGSSGNLRLTSSSTGISTTDGFSITNNGSTRVAMRQHENADWQFITHTGTTALTIDPTANVGIGTTSPAYLLDVNGSASVNNLRVNTTNLQFGAAMEVANRANIIGAGSPNLFIGNDGSNYVQLIYNSAGYGQLFTGFTHDIILSAGGNVGIGLTNPTSELEVAGDIEIPAANDYTYSTAKTHYQSYAPTAFRAQFPSSEDFQTFNAVTLYGYFVNGSGAVGYSTVSVNLPDGALVTELEGWIYDNLSSRAVRVRLLRQELGTSTSLTMATVESTTANATIVVQNLIDNTIFSGTIDNSRYAYFLRFSGADNSDLTRLYGARITYTVTEAD